MVVSLPTEFAVQWQPEAESRVPMRMKARERKQPALTPQDIAETRARARQIGKLLHLAFDEVTREPVPSEFLELLGQLEEREAQKRRCH
jgi:hypothetical protein